MSTGRLLILIVMLALGINLVEAQEKATKTMQQPTVAPVQRFVIEREIPGAGRMTAKELREAATKSNEVLRRLGPDIQWVQSYVTGDKLYCVYTARSADLIRQHAAQSGFPASRILPVSAVIDPTTEKQ
jgi:hypothetical protein